MANRPILFSTLLLITLSIPAAVSAQTGAASYRVPSKVDLHPIVRQTFSDYFGGDGLTPPETEGFFPIGWSRNGKFAYYVEPVDEACGCYFAELRIQDLNSDKVLWEFKNDPESRTNADGSPIEDDIRRLWRRNRKLFNRKLAEYGIVPATRFTLLGRSFSSGGRLFTANLTTRKTHNDGFGLDYIRSVKLELSSPALGRKTLYSAENNKESYPTLEMAVAGALKSPFENRAAVVMVYIVRGWEGPPHPVSVQIAGADLKNGFEK